MVYLESLFLNVGVLVKQMVHLEFLHVGNYKCNAEVRFVLWSNLAASPPSSYFSLSCSALSLSTTRRRFKSTLIIFSLLPNRPLNSTFPNPNPNHISLQFQRTPNLCDQGEIFPNLSSLHLKLGQERSPHSVL